MNLSIPKNKSELIHHLCDPLFKNSIFIMLTSVSSAGFGFIFWMLAAKMYSPEDVGIATALISSMALLVLISRFGLDSSIIRFFPINDKSRIFNTCVIITTFFAVLFGVIFIIGVDTFSPELYILKIPFNAAFYLIFLATSSIIALSTISFVAIRKAVFQFLQSIVVGSRILFLIPLMTFGAIGIFGAVGISFIFAFLLALFLLAKSGIRLGFIIDREFLNEAFNFSAGNYLAGIFTMGPNFILPILVMNTLGAENAAYYYIAYSISALLFVIPNSISMSLFVEGSHGEALKKNVMRSLVAIFSILLPAIIILYVVGGSVLGVVGADYATNGLRLLRMMVVANIFVSINFIYLSIMRIQKDMSGLMLLSSLVFVLLIGLSYIFMLMFGIVGVGYAWVMSYGIGSVMVGMTVWRNRWV